MRTEKQIKASKRNFTLMYLTGVITTLQMLHDSYLINPYHKAGISMAILNLKRLCTRIRELDDYQQHFYGSKKPQKDVKYECKSSD